MTVYGGLERLSVSRRASSEPEEEPDGNAPDLTDSGSVKAALLRSWRILMVPLVVGLLLRLVLAPYTSWTHDVASWWWTATGGAQHVRIYHRLGFPYPPVWGELLQGLGWVLQGLGVRPSGLGVTNVHLDSLNFYDQYSTIVTTPLFNLLFKGMLTLFDLGTALLLYSMTVRISRDESKGRLAFTLWFLNPLVLFETGVFGAFDVIVGFTVLCAVYFFLNGRYFWSGAAIMIAVLTKASPVLLIPLFLVLLLDRRVTDPGRRWRNLLDYIGGNTVAAAIILVPLVATAQLGAGIHAVFARTQETSGFGGLSMFGITWFKGTEPLTHALNDFTKLGSTVLLLQLLASIGLGLLAATVARRNFPYAVIGTVGLTMAVIFLLGPVSNPQYLLWFLPEVVLLVALWRRALWALILLTVAGLVYLLTLAGPAALLFPLAQFTGIISTPTVVHSINSWSHLAAAPWSTRGAGGSFVGVTAVMVVVAVFLLARAVLWQHAPRRNRSRLDGLRGAMVALVPATIAAILGVALISQVVVAVTPSGAAVNLATSSSGSSLAVTAAVTPGPSLDRLQLAAFPVSTSTLPDRIEVYGDRHFPVSGTSAGAVAGVWDQLHALLPLRGYKGALDHIGANQLRSELLDVKDAPHTMVVFTAGILPDTVFSAKEDLMTPWLHAGGTLVWGGTKIGYFTGSRGEKSNQANYPDSLLNTGTARFIDPALIGPTFNPADTAGVAAPPARALRLIWRFNDGGPIVYPPTAGIFSQGWIGKSNGQSSLTNVASGSGHVLLFASQIANEHLIAPDITMLAMSGVANANGSFSALAVPSRISQHGGVVHWQPRLGTTTGDIRVVAFDPTTEGLLFTSSTSTPARGS